MATMVTFKPRHIRRPSWVARVLGLSHVVTTRKRQVDVPQVTARVTVVDMAQQPFDWASVDQSFIRSAFWWHIDHCSDCTRMGMCDTAVTTLDHLREAEGISAWT